MLPREPPESPVLEQEESWESLLLTLSGIVTGDIFDATTGQLLKRELVQKAREEEMEYFKAKQVWVKRPVEEAQRMMGKPPISVK